MPVRQPVEDIVRSRGTKANVLHLQKRLEQSGRWSGAEALTMDSLKDLLCARFSETDFDSAKQDVLPFIKDPSALDLWSKEFFSSVTLSRL